VREGIEQFIAFRKGKTVAAEGRRPQLSREHWSGRWKPWSEKPSPTTRTWWQFSKPSNS
jgi:hypothetical protein